MVSVIKGGMISLRLIHVAIILSGQVFLIGGVYAITKFQVEDHAKRIEKLEEATSGIKESREDIQRRLQKVEDKLDILILNQAAKK